MLDGRQLTYRLPDGSLALDAVSIHVPSGNIHCVLGAAGAGKTALLHCFVGLIRPMVGVASVCGFRVDANPIIARRRITYVPKGASLYGNLTALENLQFFTEVDGRRNVRRRQEYYNVMRRVGIPERAFARRTGHLGRSIALSIWLAIALLKESPAILMDEPTVGLDLYTSSDLHETLTQLREQHKALLITTSDVLLAAKIADRVSFLKEGRKTTELTRPQLVDRSLLELYAEYMERPIPPGS